MGVACDVLADLDEVQLHGLGVGPWQNKGGAFSLCRANGSKYVGVFVTLIRRLCRPCATSGPNARASVLLTDTRLVLPPDFNLFIAGHFGQMRLQGQGEVFLKASMIRTSCPGCLGRVLI